MKKIIEDIVDFLLWIPVALSFPFILLGRLLHLKKRHFLALVLKYIRWKLGLEGKRKGLSFESYLDTNKAVKKMYNLMWEETGLK